MRAQPNSRPLLPTQWGTGWRPDRGDAARALSQQKWTTPLRMAEASWADRAHVLNRAGYARYDERTSTMLGSTAQLLLDKYGGDLRRLRAAAGRRTADLGEDARPLSRIASGDDFVRLVSGLVRVDLDDAYDEVTAPGRG